MSASDSLTQMEAVRDLIPYGYNVRPIQPTSQDLAVHSIKLTAADMRILGRLFEDDLIIQNEPLHDRSFDAVVQKPWGWECRVYADHFVDIWLLRIASGEQTSMHAHIKKTTHLLCLSGQGLIRSLQGEQPIHSGSMISIAPGAFHCTRSSDRPLTVIEVEAPRNKLDLIRYEDTYDRDRTRYERIEDRTAVSDMTRIDSMPGASIRSTSPDRAFVFQVRSGSMIEPDSDTRDFFYIPTGLAALLSPDTVSALRPSDLVHRNAQPDIDYLVVRKAD